MSKTAMEREDSQAGWKVGTGINERCFRWTVSAHVDAQSGSQRRRLVMVNYQI